MNRAKQFGLLTMVFLVLLRLAIGWHFVCEGIHKIDSFVHDSKPWTSAGYFREAPGPLAWEVRQHIGDPDDEARDRLTVQPLPAGEDPAKQYLRTPPGLHEEWEDYLQRYADAYGLNDKQRDLAHAKMEENENTTVHWLTMTPDPKQQRQAADDDEIKRLKGKLEQIDASPNPGANADRATIQAELKRLDDLKKLEAEGYKVVEKASPSGGAGTIKVLESPAERIDEYRKKVQEYRALLDDTDATFGADVAGTKRLTAKGEAATMRKSLMDDLDKKTDDFKASLGSVLTPEQQNTDVVLRGPTPQQWWIDGCTAWGLAIVGGCLVLGLLSRTNCVLAAGFLLMTYFVSPPWPWLPTPPNTEGNYLFVNKNVIEMFALLALATTASGRWFGVDALIHWTFRALFGRKTPQPAPAQRAA